MKKEALEGLFWTIIDAVGSKVITLIIQIILARVLLPSDFGIIGMITILIAISQTLLDSGFQNALIREKKVSNTEYSTVFMFNVFMSVVLYIILFMSSDLVASFYDTPVLSNIIKVLGIVLVINSFGLVQRTVLTKELNFRLQTKISIISVLISGGLAIFLAISGFGVWSLVIQQITNQLFQTIMLIIYNRWIPILIFDFTAFKKFFSFGWKLTVSSLINTMYQNIFYVIIGRFYSSTELGYYTNSQKFNDVPVQTMTQAIQKVTYPLLSKLNSEGRNLKENYRLIIRYSSSISFMMMMALGGAANILIPFIFGKNWVNSVPYFQILCLAGMFYPLNAINLNILQVKGRSDLFLKLEIVKKIIGISFIAFSFIIGTGIYGLVWSGVLATLFNTCLNIIISTKIINYTFKEQINDISVFLINSIIMGILIFIIGQISNLPVVITLFIQALIGILVYFSIGCYILKIPEISRLLIVIKKFFRV